jgi:drug/metabolite transporter (DMT)-like permease
MIEFGALAALSGALFWAIAYLVYARLGSVLSPLLLNFSKGIIAIVCLVITLGLTTTTIPHLPLAPLLGLALSGIFGIGLGDTVSFAALRYLNARYVLLLSILSPPVTAILAQMSFNEFLSGWAWIGIGMTLLGIVIVIQERTSAAATPALRSQLYCGISLSILSVVLNSVGALLARVILANTPITPLWGALIRLCAGEGILALFLVFIPAPWQQWQSLGKRSVGLPLLGAAFLGTYLGIWLQVASLKYTAVGIAQTLSATSPIFLLIISRLLGKTVSWRAWIGSAIALGGVSILMFSANPLP